MSVGRDASHAIAVAFAVLASAQVAVLLHERRVMIEWGTLGEWVSGVGSAAAIVIASIALKREQEDRSRQRDQEERQQAENVTFLASEEPRTSGGAFIQDVSVLNLSAGVATGVYVEVSYGPHTLSKRVGHMSPGTRKKLTVPLDPPPSDDSKGVTWLVHVTLHFTDNAGRRWFRDPLGTLHRAREHELDLAALEPMTIDIDDVLE